MSKRPNKLLFNVINSNLFVLGIVWRISKLRFIIKLFVTVISAILPTVNILIMRYIISLLESNIERTQAILVQIFVFILGLIIAQLIPKLFIAFNTALIEPVLVAKVNNHMNNIFFEKAREFEYKNFEDPIFYDKYTRALRQTDSITHSVFNTFFHLFGSLLSLTALSVLIVSMDWIVILFALFTVLINFIQSMILTKLNFKTSQTLTPMSRKQNYIKRILYNAVYAKDIKLNDAISTGKRYYFDSFKEIVTTLKKYGIKIAVINVIVILLSTVSSAIIQLLLFSRVWFGIYTIANYSALISSSNQFEGTLNSFLATLSEFYRNSLEIDNLKYIFFYKSDNSDGENILNENKPYKIELKNVSFKYPNSNKYSIKNISLEISPREKISLVGLNGSGKTTLIKLIIGLYEPESGEILLNGINLKLYKKEDLYKKIGVVFQDYQIFSYSVKENISFENEIKPEVIDVLDKLDLYTEIKKMPKNMNTQLSKEFDENGTLISGGEAQKICIARALNKKAGLYIFDEPSSALDPIAEYKMNNMLCSITNNTVIFISHRLSTATMADKIFLLNNGEIVEQGTHSELLENKSFYHKLFTMQSESYIDK